MNLKKGINRAWLAIAAFSAISLWLYVLCFVKSGDPSSIFGSTFGMSIIAGIVFIVVYLLGIVVTNWVVKGFVGDEKVDSNDNE